MKKILIACSLLISFLLGAGTVKFRYSKTNVAHEDLEKQVGNVPYSSPWWNFRVQQFKSEINKPIVMVGDSRINIADWDYLLDRNDVSNRGISGETSNYVPRRLNTSIPKHAKIIFVQTGINDLSRGASDQDVLKSFASIIEILKPKTDSLVIMPIIQSGHMREDLHSRIAKLNPQLKSLARTKKTDWVDVDSLYESGYLPDSDTADGVHFATSYLKLAKIIDAKLKVLEGKT